MSRSQRFAELRSAVPTILPSLLLCDFGDLATEVKQLQAADVKALHLDVMDGQFVPNLTYGMPIVEGLRGKTDQVLDVHLMIEKPERFVKQFVDAGSDSITIHVESTDQVGETLQQIRDHGVAAGIALNPETPLSEIEPYLDLCDLALVMTVKPGFGGQAFNPAGLEKLASLRKQKPDLFLQVDGGVNASTIADCVKAGADLLVVGSAIFKKEDYKAALDELYSLLA